MMKGSILAMCLLVALTDSAVILLHPNYYLHDGHCNGHHELPLYYLEGTDRVDSTDYSSDFVPAFESGGDFKRTADYGFNDIESRHRDNGGDIMIPNYRMFHFVLRLVRSMRRHFLPVYATHPDDISNIYAQYDQHELRRR